MLGFGKAYVNINNCSNEGEIKSVNSNSAGIVGGGLGSEVNITECYNNGNITSDSNCAGICAAPINNVENCINDGEIRSLNGTAIGIVYSANIIINCYNNGYIDGGYSAGIVYQTIGKVINCYNKGNVRGTVWNVKIGGICSVFSGKMVNCYNTAEVFSDSTWNYAGGLIGSSKGGEMTNCYSSGIVKKGGSQFGEIGGLVGTGDGKIIVNNCYYLESVAPKGIVGATEDKSQAISSEYMQSQEFVDELNKYVDENSTEEIVLSRWKYNEGEYPTFE